MTVSEAILPETERGLISAVIETERLVLRAPLPQDAEAIARLGNDKRIAINTARLPHPYGIKDAERFIACTNRQDGAATFVVSRAETPIGVCGVDPREHGPEIGYWFGVPYWGQGYATEAVRALLGHAFAELRYETLLAGARVSNPASRRVLEKCGFQWTGVELTRIRAINSAAPSDRFRLDRRLWESLRSWGRVRGAA